MTGIDYFAWLVFIVIILSAVYVFVALAQLPGSVARKRGHPQADAINVAGWIGLLTAGVVWVIAIIWAHMRPVIRPYEEGDELDALRQRVTALEGRLAGGEEVAVGGEGR